MSHVTRGRLSHQVRKTCAKERSVDRLPFSHLLDPDRVRHLIEELGGLGRRCVLCPVTIFFGFLVQVTSADQSCQQAATDLLAWLAVRGAALPSGDTGPYCKARTRLPDELPKRLAREVGNQLHAQAQGRRLLRGRKIKVLDGSTASMADTEANQEAYPQAKTQKPGLGFPIMRFVAVLCLHCGALLELAHGPYKGKETGETALLRSLMDSFEAGDIALADRCFCSFWQIALFAQRGVDSLFRMHQKRKVDFRAGRRLGRHDHIVTWHKPAKPDWMEQQVYESLPDQMEVREVKVTIRVPGFRVKTLVLATTLLDAQLYPAAELARAFRARWHAEVDLRAIKVAMQMDVLRCKTPAMIQKELWMHLLAYNLVRQTMMEAADGAGLEPRQISFTTTMQYLRSFAPMRGLIDSEVAAELDDVMLQAIARRIVGDRPDRYEPRAVKRRAKCHRLLNEPREDARKRMRRAA